MSSTTFSNGTVIPVDWLNEVNALLWGSASPPSTPIRVDLSGVASFYGNTNQDVVRVVYTGGPTGTNGGAINFYNYNNSNVPINLARIYCQTTSGAVGNEAGDLLFLTKPAGGSLTYRAKITDIGDTVLKLNTTAPTLQNNTELVFTLTSNTNLRISVRGSDGVTRTANITLA